MLEDILGASCMLHHQQQQKQEEAVCSKEGEEASASVMNCRLSPCRNLGTILKMSSCTIKAGENVSFFSFLARVEKVWMQCQGLFWQLIIIMIFGGVWIWGNCFQIIKDMRGFIFVFHEEHRKYYEYPEYWIQMWKSYKHVLTKCWLLTAWLFWNVVTHVCVGRALKPKRALSSFKMTIVIQKLSLKMKIVFATKKSCVFWLWSQSL